MTKTMMLLLAMVAAETSLATDKRPNVVLIVTDDQGYGDLSCHGNPVLKTPNLDRLHGESVRLTDYHVAPTCAPTRRTSAGCGCRWCCRWCWSICEHIRQEIED